MLPGIQEVRSPELQTWYCPASLAKLSISDRARKLPTTNGEHGYVVLAVAGNTDVLPAARPEVPEAVLLGYSQEVRLYRDPP